MKKNYKFVIIKPSYGDIYNYCYKDLEKYDFVELHNDYIQFKSKIEKWLYFKHLSNKYYLPFRSLWNKRYFKNKFNKNDYIVFICYYPHIKIFNQNTRKYIKKRYPNSSMVLFLNDIVSMNIKEENVEIMKNIFDIILSFDYSDCNKYGFFNQSLVYSSLKENSQITEDIDVYFCGKAKGRLPIIIQTYYKLQKEGLNCLFFISDVLDKDKIHEDGIIYIDKFMPYNENINYIQRSKCLLEIMQEGGSGYTLRTCEAVAFNKKILSNNKNLKKSEFYNENMISIFNSIDDIDVKFIKQEKEEYKDINYFSPIKLLEKVIKILEDGFSN